MITNRKPLLAIVSPFLDKSHGTERIVIEWIAQLANEFEIHVYSQQVQDIDLGTIFWHRIPKLPGPHLMGFLWWFTANRVWRAWDGRFRGLRYDIVFSPGTNCLDADIVSVHIVFAELLRRVESELELARNPVRSWPRLLHRRLYYHIVGFLERRVYTNSETFLILMARKTAADLDRSYQRWDRCAVLYPGLDHAAYNSVRRASHRQKARKQLGLGDERFVLLLIGNDWRNKGVAVLLDVLARLHDLLIDLLIVTREDPETFRPLLADRGLDTRVRILPPRSDVEFYYAAADAYAGPSLEDSFALPPAEAMACGLPVIVSAAAGVSEIITHGVDGLILADPKDATTLSSMVRRLYEDSVFRERLGERASATMQQYTWDGNGHELSAIFEGILRRKSKAAAQDAGTEH